MTEFPAWSEPMAATLTPERFTAPGWVFERKKIDGAGNGVRRVRR